MWMTADDIDQAAGEITLRFPFNLTVHKRNALYPVAVIMVLMIR